MNLVTRIAGTVAIVVAAFAVDQLTKAWALSYLGATREIDLAMGASLRLVFNPGVAFGIGADAGAPLVVGIIVLTTALLVWIFVRVVRRRSAAATALLAIAAGGALGNVWDRITRAGDAPLTGHVVDFIAIDWFAVFNVADIFTTLGVIGWAVLFLFRNNTETTSNSGAESAPLS
jgi:signal peptidase II